jgi:hypothetical protein
LPELSTAVGAAFVVGRAALEAARFGAGVLVTAGCGAGVATVAGGGAAAIGAASGFGLAALDAAFLMRCPLVTGFSATAFWRFFAAVFVGLGADFALAFDVLAFAPPPLVGAALLPSLPFGFDFFAMARMFKKKSFRMSGQRRDGRDAPGHRHSQST